MATTTTTAASSSPPYHPPPLPQLLRPASRSSLPPVTRSSSFTRSKRFLTGAGLSARESLGIIDDPLQSNPDLSQTSSIHAFDLARTALISVLCVETAAPPPPPQLHLTPSQRHVLYTAQPPKPPSLPAFVKPVDLRPSSWAHTQPRPYLRVPSHPHVENPPSSSSIVRNDPVDRLAGSPLPAKYDPNQSLDSQSNAMLSFDLASQPVDVLQYSSQQCHDDLSDQEEQELKSQPESEPDQQPQLPFRVAQQQQPHSPTQPNPPSSENPETKNNLSSRLHSLRHSKPLVEQNSDSKPKLSIPKLSITSDKSKRSSRPLSPLLVGSRLRKAAKPFTHNDPHLDNPNHHLTDSQPSSPQQFSPSRSKTVSRLRNIFSPRLSPHDGKLEPFKSDAMDDADTEPASSEKVEESEEQRSVSKEEKSSASAEDTIPSCSTATSSPNAHMVPSPHAKVDAGLPAHKVYPSDDSELSDMADHTSLNKTHTFINTDPSKEQYRRPGDMCQSNLDQKIALQHHSSGTATISTPTATISLPPRNDQPLEIRQLTSTDPSLEQFEDASEEQIPAIKKDSVRKRIDFFKRFRAIPEGSSPFAAAKLVAEPPRQGEASPTVPLSQRSEEKKFLRSITAPLPQGRRRVEVVVSRGSVSDDTVSFMTANEEFSPPPSLRQSEMSGREKQLKDIEQSPKSGPPTSESAPVAEHSTEVSPPKPLEDRPCQDLAGPQVAQKHSTPSANVTITNQFDLPIAQTEPKGVSAQGFMDGPVSEPVQEDPSASIKNRKDSHTAFLFPQEEGNASERDEQNESNADGKQQTSDTRKAAVTVFQRRLAKAKEAGSVIVSRAKKLPRGKSMPHLRTQDGPVPSGRAHGSTRMKSSSVQQKEADIKPEDFSKNARETTTDEGIHEPKPVPTDVPEPKENTRDEDQTTAKGANGEASKASEGSAKEAKVGSKDESKKTTRKKDKPLPEYVTVQRIIRRVRADGSVETIRKQIRLKPLQILPNGDVVVQRPMKRMKDDGTGFELLNVTQIIPCRKTKKRTEPQPRPSLKQAIADDADETSSLPDLSSLRRPEVNAIGEEEEGLQPSGHDDGQARLKDRAFSMPSSSVINKKSGPGPSILQSSRPRRSRSSHTPSEKDKEVRFQVPRSSSASAIDSIERKPTGSRRSRLLNTDRWRNWNTEGDKEGRRSRGRLWPLAARVLSRQKNEGEERRRVRGHGRGN